MNAPILRVVLLVFCTCVVIPHSVGAQSLASRRKEQAKFLLDEIEQQIAKISNFRCQKVTPVDLTQQTADPTTVRYRHEWLACDQQGRGRIRMLESGRVSAQIWDGEKTIGHVSLVDPNGSISHQVSIAAGIHYQIQRQQEPWDYLGRDLANLLTKAIADDYRIRVSQTNAGQYRLDIRDDSSVLHTALLDPNQGYAPVYRRVYADRKVQALETVTFEQIKPGIWFPIEVWTEIGPQRTRLPEPVLKCRFTSISVDNWDFEKSLRLELAKGTEVRDSITGQTYIVGEDTIELLASPDPTPTDANTPSLESPAATPAWRVTFDAMYRLEDGQALKCIAPPFIPERHQYLVSTEPDLAGQTDRVTENRLYRFAWDDGIESDEQVASNRFFKLSSVLENVIGLDSYQYEGLAHLLNLSVAGDWIARKDTPTEQLLSNLEQIVQEQKQWSIGFVKQQVDAIVIRVSGTYRFRALPRVSTDAGVHIYAGNLNTLRGDMNQDSDCGTLVRFLSHVGHKVGMRFVDDTKSSDIELCWVSHDTAQLHKVRNQPSVYNARLISLLNNLTRQTGLTFSAELGTIDRWQVISQRNATARSN